MSASKPAQTAERRTKLTVFDDEIPAVTNLDPALRGALRKAATVAADNGVEFFVNSDPRTQQ